MHISRLKLTNWRNFTEVDVPLEQRVFIIGNNGTGKSNLLDALRFLHDIAKQGGSLYHAVEKRGGFRYIRSLFAGRNNKVSIGVEVVDETAEDKKVVWHYDLTLKNEGKGKHRILVEKEVVKKLSYTKGEVGENKEEEILDRPNDNDMSDDENLTQTALEQILVNKDFRELAHFFARLRYLHMVPQLIRHADEFQGKMLEDDPFGQGFLSQMSDLNKRTRDSRLRRMTKSIQTIKPEFSNFEYLLNNKGRPNLRFKYDDWRRDGTFLNEQHLSDGELRFIGLIWTLMENNNVTMLEEPELSFNEGIIKALPSIFYKALRDRKKKTRQVILTTHSGALLSDKGIGGEEVVLLRQISKGRSEAKIVSNIKEIKGELDAGLPISQTVALSCAQSSPQKIGQLSFGF